MVEMEDQTTCRPAVITRRICKSIKLLLLIFKTGIISNTQSILFHLHFLLKRGNKLAVKAAESIAYTLVPRCQHHHRHHIRTSSFSTKHFRNGAFLTSIKDYEFSCSNSPAPTIFVGKHYDNTDQHPETTDSSAVVTLSAAVQHAFDILNTETVSTAVSPAVGLPGFGNSPMMAVRQLRVTDSPFPLNECSSDEEAAKVNRAAEEFIQNFYSDLRKQRLVVGHSTQFC